MMGLGSRKRKRVAEEMGVWARRGRELDGGKEEEVEH
jgi:hypothetical protein